MGIERVFNFKPLCFSFLMFTICVISIFGFCGEEINYLRHGKRTMATVEKASERIVEEEFWDEEEGVYYTQYHLLLDLTYSFKDSTSDLQRTESTTIRRHSSRSQESLKIGGEADFYEKHPELEIQYIPGAKGESRHFLKGREFFLALVVGIHVLVTGVFCWGQYAYVSDMGRLAQKRRERKEKPGPKKRRRKDRY